MEFHRDSQNTKWNSLNRIHVYVAKINLWAFVENIVPIFPFPHARPTNPSHLQHCLASTFSFIKYIHNMLFWKITKQKTPDLFTYAKEIKLYIVFKIKWHFTFFWFSLKPWSWKEGNVSKIYSENNSVRTWQQTSREAGGWV